MFAWIAYSCILLDFSDSDVPKVRMDLVTKKSLLKLAVRLMRNYKISDGKEFYLRIFVCKVWLLNFIGCFHQVYERG